MSNQAAAHNRKLIDAALRYVAVADWFERRPLLKSRHGEVDALDTFNRAEANLRRIAEPMLRGHGVRAEILRKAGADNVEPQNSGACP